MLALTRDLLLDALSVLMPVDCAGCGKRDRAMCGPCRSRLEAPLTVATAGGLSVISALRYEDEVRAAIVALKETNRTDAARPLAGPFARAVTAVLADHPGVEVIAVPTSPAAFRRRGYDPVRLLLGRAGFRPARVLRSTGVATRQKALGAAARAANVRGTMAARMSLGGRRFVLADDVLTTGATLAEASRAIREAGGEVLAAATLAFTPKLLGEP